MAVNAKTEEAVFKIHRGRLTVNGSFITEVHLTARVDRGAMPSGAAGMGSGGSQPTAKWALVSFWAPKLNSDHAE